MIKIETSPSTTNLVITGELDLVDHGKFAPVTARVAGLRRQVLVIDMCRVTFMDSIGAAFLITLADSCRKRGGSTILRGCDDRHLFILEICGALDLFHIDTVHTCTAALPAAEAAIGGAAP